jgi:hypothetical protein
MSIDDFWDIVERVHAASPGDMQNKCRHLADELRRLSADEVLSFGTHFSDCFFKAYHWDIWGAAFVITQGCCGDDSFMDFRSTLISLGRPPFEAAVREADSLADFDIDPDWATYEGYQYVASQIYREKTGGEEPPRHHSHPKEVSGVPFVEWELSRRLPRLAAKYGHKDSDYAVEKERAAKLEKKEQGAAVMRQIMLEGIIPSCGVIPPYRVVAKVLRSGRSPESSNLHRTWAPFDFEETHYWTAAFQLEKIKPEELHFRPDLKGVQLKIDHRNPETDEFEDWMRTLKDRGMA